MCPNLGIGITTYNRCESLEQCLSSVRERTRVPFHLVVADDGSTDETAAVCGNFPVSYVRGKNMGIAWNKNRALFFLDQIVGCSVVILLEDDCFPNRKGWESDWITAAQEWGHVNFGAEWMHQHLLEGEGTVTHPFLSDSVSGQCASFSRDALSVCGFLDSRFKSYGYEHAEHSDRLVRAGFGGKMRMGDRGELEPYYYLLSADFTVLPNHSYRDEQSLVANWEAWRRMYGDPVYRHPWRSRAELRQFRSEIDGAVEQMNLGWTRRWTLRRRWSAWRRAVKCPR